MSISYHQPMGPTPSTLILWNLSLKSTYIHTLESCFCSFCFLLSSDERSLFFWGICPFPVKVVGTKMTLPSGTIQSHYILESWPDNEADTEERGRESKGRKWGGRRQNSDDITGGHGSSQLHSVTCLVCFTKTSMRDISIACNWKPLTVTTYVHLFQSELNAKAHTTPPSMLASLQR